MIIYKATNIINGKVYIGQTKYTLEKRKHQHLVKARKGIQTHFYQAIRKYGEDKFEWEIVCEAKTKKELNKLETYYIGYYDSIKHGYNMVDWGDNNVMEVDYVRAKHDAKMRSPEVRYKISQSMKKRILENGFSEEHRRKLSESQRGRKYSPERCKKCATRSIGVYCIYDDTRYDFTSIKEAGEWWYKTLKPIEHYSTATYQKKIIQNINLGYCWYTKSGSGSRPKIKIDNIKWFYKE